MHILDSLEPKLEGLNACIIGRGKLVGYPLSLMMTHRKINVVLLNEHH